MLLTFVQVFIVPTAHLNEHSVVGGCNRHNSFAICRDDSSSNAAV